MPYRCTRYVKTECHHRPCTGTPRMATNVTPQFLQKRSQKAPRLKPGDDWPVAGQATNILGIVPIVPACVRRSLEALCTAPIQEWCLWVPQDIVPAGTS